MCVQNIHELTVFKMECYCEPPGHEISSTLQRAELAQKYLTGVCRISRSMFYLSNKISVQYKLSDIYEETEIILFKELVTGKKIPFGVQINWSKWSGYTT